MKQLTIIIQTYNSSEKFINTIRSVVNQSNKNFKIIVYDDGSKDFAWIKKGIAILKETGTEFEFIKGVNRGAGLSRNESWKFAKTDYVFRLDHDDAIKGDFVQKFYGIIMKKEYDIIKLTDTNKKFGFTRWNLLLLFKYNNYAWFPSSMIINRNTFKKSLYPDTTPEDHMSIFYFMAKAKTIKYKKMGLLFFPTTTSDYTSFYNANKEGYKKASRYWFSIAGKISGKNKKLLLNYIFQNKMFAKYEEMEMFFSGLSISTGVVLNPFRLLALIKIKRFFSKK